MVSWVEVLRGGVVESRHRVSIAVAGAAGDLLHVSGDAGLVTYARSAIKPLQALPLVDDGVTAQFGMTEAELALACASHSGEAVHVETARSLLAKLGADESALACGPHWPFDATAAAALRSEGARPGRIHNNCSGKHAGMLALAAAHGWPMEGYQQPGHAVQQRMLEVLAQWSGVPAAAMSIGVDGCGVATFALPLSGLAAAFGRFSAAAARGDAAPAAVVAAMAGHPHLVGGTGRLCTEVLRASGGRVVAKVGAEGVYCAAVLDAGMGLALKVEDGAVRAAEPALLGVLQWLGALDSAELAALASYARPVLRNTRDEVVGEVRAVVRLGSADG